MANVLHQVFYQGGNYIMYHLTKIFNYINIPIPYIFNKAYDNRQLLKRTEQKKTGHLRLFQEKRRWGGAEQNLKMGVPPTQFYLFLWYSPY